MIIYYTILRGGIWANQRMERGMLYRNELMLLFAITTTNKQPVQYIQYRFTTYKHTQ
jgi:hypothetical protein